MAEADPLYCISLADLINTQNCQDKSHLEEISGNFLVKNFDILKTIKDDWVLAIITPEYGMPACPVPPTDLVFASDFHTEVTSQIFERMREIMTVMVNVTKIRD